MTEEELKKAIRLLITWYDGEGDLVDGIVMLIREAGWRSPEEVEDKIKDTLASIEVFLPEGWPMPLGFDSLIAELIKEPQ